MQEGKLAAIESDYSYVLGELQGRVLDMQAVFLGGDFLSDELDLIKEEMVSTAKTFAINQGLSGVGNTKRTSLLHYSNSRNKDGMREVYSIAGSGEGPTGNLLSHIKGFVDFDNQTVTIYNDATNSRGQYYAGHIEFGFHDRGGNLIPARPFMRPAFYAVSDASRGRIQGTMKRYLESIWTLEPLRFGYPVTETGHYRKFYEKSQSYGDRSRGQYTKNAILGIGQKSQGRLPKMRSEESRMRQTVDRRNQSTSATLPISLRMGKKGGWQVDSKGQEVYKHDTQWVKFDTKSSKILSSKTYSVTQRKTIKVVSGGRMEYIAKDGTAFPSNREAIRYQNGVTDGITRKYTEKVSYTRSTSNLRGKFGFKRRK